MEYLEVRELGLADLEAEGLRVQKSIEETEQFLNSLNSLTEQEVADLEKLKRNLELLKSYEKKENKQKFLTSLKERQNNIKKAVETMKAKGQTKYDPRDVKWDSN